MVVIAKYFMRQKTLNENGNTAGSSSVVAPGTGTKDDDEDVEEEEEDEEEEDEEKTLPAEGSRVS